MLNLLLIFAMFALCVFLFSGVRGLPFVIVSLLTALLAWPAFAADPSAAPAPVLSPELMAYVLIALAVAELARRVAAVIPGRRDDEVAGALEGILRRVVDFLGGVPKDPKDPGLLRRDDPEE